MIRVAVTASFDLSDLCAVPSFLSQLTLALRMKRVAALKLSPELISPAAALSPFFPLSLTVSVISTADRASGPYSLDRSTR